MVQKINTLQDITLDQTKLFFLVFSQNLLECFITAGVTGNFLKNFEEHFPKLRSELPDILGVTRGYLNAFSGTNNSLPLTVARKILLVAQVCLHGLDTFEDSEKFQGWMYSKPAALGGKRPVDLLSSEEGMRELHILLGRIEYGTYS